MSRAPQFLLSDAFGIRLFQAIGLLGLVVLGSACRDTPPEEVVFDPTPYTFEARNFPPPNLPSDNALTEAGVLLGRMLFHDPRLSADNSQACADCHVQADGFSDPRRFSIGIQGAEGSRQAMALHNMAWHLEGFFWDHRAATLREQSLMPIQDPLEMDADLASIVAKLNGIQGYKDQCVRAFGEDEITAERMGLAMEQFMLTLVSDDSKFDRVQRGEASFSASEQRGGVCTDRCRQLGTACRVVDMDGDGRILEPFVTGQVRQSERERFRALGFQVREHDHVDKALADVAGVPLQCALRRQEVEPCRGTA